MNKIVIILGGGDGTRAGGPLPKQFQEINNKPILEYSISTFLKSDANLSMFIVLHPSFLDEWEEKIETLERMFGTPVYLVCGGKSRWHSVANALTMIKAMELVNSQTLIAIHDGARPLVTTQLIDSGWKAAENVDGAIPVVKITDSLREILPNNENKTVDRNRFRAVQTPQIFNSEVLINAYSQPYSNAYTDDASVVEAAGYKVALFPGDTNNIKITNPIDFEIAKTLINNLKK